VRLGILSDIHGNRIALEAVLADGYACGVDAWWALGDPVPVGPDRVGAAVLLAGTPGPVATPGNTDRYGRDAFLDRLRESGCPGQDYLAGTFRQGD
jgi:hypothetical protein